MSSFQTVIGRFFLKVQWQQASLELQDFPYDPGCVQQRGILEQSPMPQSLYWDNSYFLIP